MNIKYLRIAYEQYFCNIFDLTDQELLSFHFKANEALDKDEDIFWDDIALEPFLIWQPFEDTMPTHIFDNVLELYKSITDVVGEDNSQLCLELSSDLAEEAVAEYFTDSLNETFEYTASNGDTRYNEDAQEMFNEKQAFYESKIKEHLGQQNGTDLR